MQRTLMLEPDQELEAPDGSVIAVVSREALLQALSDLEAVVHVAGGHFTVVTQRAPVPGGPDGQRVTTRVMCQWQDRTNARAQPEQDTMLPTPAPPAAAPVATAPAAAQLDGQPIALTPEDLEAILRARQERVSQGTVVMPAVDETPVMSPEEAMRALEEGIPQAPPPIHPDEPHDPDEEDVSEIPEEQRTAV